MPPEDALSQVIENPVLKVLLACLTIGGVIIRYFKGLRNVGRVQHRLPAASIFAAEFSSSSTEPLTSSTT
jgi:hypothetical protein